MRKQEDHLYDETCHSKGVNVSNKIMVFLPGLAQIFQFCEILQRARDLGWTEMLIPLPFRGQSSTEDVEAVFSDPAVLASTGKYPMVQTHAKEKMFLHGILDTKGVTKMGHATACMDLPCEWAQFLYTCAERGLEDRALILIATWYRQGPAMTQQSM